MRGATAAGGFQEPRWGRLPRREGRRAGVRAGASAQAGRGLGPRLPGGVRTRSRAPGVRRSPPGSGAPQAAPGTRAGLPPRRRHQLPATLRLAGHHGKPGERAGRRGGASAFARRAGGRPRPCRLGDAAGRRGAGLTVRRGPAGAGPQRRARRTHPASVGTTPGRLVHRRLIRKARRGRGSQGRGASGVLGAVEGARRGGPVTGGRARLQPQDPGPSGRERFAQVAGQAERAARRSPAGCRAGERPDPESPRAPTAKTAAKRIVSAEGGIAGDLWFALCFLDISVFFVRSLRPRDFRNGHV